MLSTVLMASALALPEIANPQQIYGRYPAWAMRENKSAATLAEIVVSPDGKARDCRVVSFVGDERLAGQECETLQKVKYKPARGKDGIAIQGKYRLFVIRQHPSVPDSRVRAFNSPADVTLLVNGLSKDGPAFDVKLKLFVSGEGAVVVCEETERNGGMAWPAEVTTLACTEAAKRRFDGLVDESGVAGDYITSMIVRFEGAS